MNIPYMASKIKGFLTPTVALVLAIILVGVGSFGLGRLSALEGQKSPVWVDQAAATAHMEGEGRVVGSQNGSVYHLPWCSGAQRILEGNKVWFNSKEDAERAGYRPAGNCKGI